MVQIIKLVVSLQLVLIDMHMVAVMVVQVAVTQDALGVVAAVVGAAHEVME
jgi:hypothetical protein